MYITKSKFIEFLKCRKMIYLENLNIEKNITNLLGLTSGNTVGEYARRAFDDLELVKYDSNLDNMILNTNELLKKDYSVIGEASFKYNDLFCSNDILVKEKDKYYLYEVKSNKDPSRTDMEEYKQDLSFQLYVLLKNNIKVEKAYLMHLNKDYIREGDLNYNKLFVLEDLTKEVYDNQEFVDNKINEIREYLKEFKDYDLFLKCNNCPYFNYCTKDLVKPNVFDLKSKLSFNKKLDLYKRGYIDLNSIPKDELNKDQLQELEYRLKENTFIDKNKINDFLLKLKGNIYYLDFETYSNPIPLYEGDTVNEVIPFQYSLHYEEDGVVKHKEFLDDTYSDPRRKLAEQLLKDIPTNVVVLAYSSAVEKGIIKKLAKKFPDLSKDLLKISDNIVDLAIPFQKRYYYSTKMEGSYSIKKVQPALLGDIEELDYSKLDIHKGDQAASTYLGLSYLTYKEQLQIREQLLRYCLNDTLVMVRIVESLKKLVK